MSRSLLIMPFLLIMIAAAAPAAASTDNGERKLWSKMCSACHEDSTAPSREALKEKYKTVENFQNAVFHKGDRCMNLLKNDKGLIRKIALEIGLED